MEKGIIFTLILLAFILISANNIYAAVYQKVDGFVYYEQNGTLVDVEAGMPVLRYYENHDTYHYTTTGRTLFWGENHSNYYSYGLFYGNQTQWQTAWSCNATHYGKTRFQLNSLQECINGYCKDIIIDSPVIEDSFMDNDQDGLCRFFDNCWNVFNPSQADYDGDGIGDVCDTYYCNGILFNNSNVCSGNGDCQPSGDCICDSGYYGVDCAITECWDNDEDGYYDEACGGDDCDDDDDSIYPGATETCDGIDSDCDGVLDSLENFPPLPCGEENCSGIMFCENYGYGNCTSNGSACGITLCNQLDTACADYSDILYLCSWEGVCLDEEYVNTTCEDNVVYDDGSTICGVEDIYECQPDEITLGADLFGKTIYTYCGINTGLCNGFVDSSNLWILFLECGSFEYCSKNTTACIPGYNIADINSDGKVDGADLALWQQNYDPLGTGNNTYEMGDMDEDGKVDGADLALWQQNYDPIGLGAINVEDSSTISSNRKSKRKENVKRQIAQIETKIQETENEGKIIELEKKLQKKQTLLQKIIDLITFWD